MSTRSRSNDCLNGVQTWNPVILLCCCFVSLENIERSIVVGFIEIDIYKHNFDVYNNNSEKHRRRESIRFFFIESGPQRTFGIPIEFSIQLLKCIC